VIVTAGHVASTVTRNPLAEVLFELGGSLDDALTRDDVA
jgi:hypothetical protein